MSCIKMSKPYFGSGVEIDKEHEGLLCLTEECLASIIRNEPITNVYHVEHTPFARGKFAAVRKCTHRVTGVEYAAKFIRKRRRSMDQRQEILHEVAVLRLAAGHGRIVRLHEVYETPTEMAIVLEMVGGGELQLLVDQQDGLPERQAILVMRQILEGLIFLHDHNIAHLDLKPQNMLLTGEYPGCDIKLCDFGISRVIRNGIEVREILGTPDYVAPEILSFEPISLATDIWSVGVLTYVLLSGYSPFAGETKQETFCNISQCKLTFPDELFQGVSTAAKDFIRTTLQTDPSCRLSARECLEHEWLSTTPILSVSNFGSSGELNERCDEDVLDGDCDTTSSPSPLSRTSSTYVSRPRHSDLSSLGVRRSSYPLVASCLHPSTGVTNKSTTASTSASPSAPASSGPTDILGHLSRHTLSPLHSSPVEITVDRGIIC